jgi:choice-of-anchor C domain-containing protein
MDRNVGSRFRAGVAVVAMGAAAVVVGMPGVPSTAGADPVNLIQNGSFETVTTPTTSFLPVSAGDSSTISNWTVVTPSIYPGGGSVDLVANNYWNAEDGNYSIDLAGTSGVPGGLYQNVATTPGVQYSLSFWSAVNGDQTPGVSHTMGVTVNGVALDTVAAAGVGRPLVWVHNTITFTASSANSRIEFDDTTAGDVNQGPALDNVSLTAVPDVISASPVTIAPQTTGVSFTAPVATFTDSNSAPPLSNFAAIVSWGDGTTSTGTITQSGTTFTVSGGHSYATHGTFTVGVNITSVAGSSASTSEPASVADAVTTCTNSGCSGTVTTASEVAQINSASTTGTILTSIDPASASFSCADQFRHAPQIVTVSDTALNANIVYTVTFANAKASGSSLVPFAVCYQAQTPFTDLFGHSVTTGLLPLCTVVPRPNKPIVAPCVQSITELPFHLGNVVEKIVVPPGDPRFR